MPFIRTVQKLGTEDGTNILPTFGSQRAGIQRNWPMPWQYHSKNERPTSEPAIEPPVSSTAVCVELGWAKDPGSELGPMWLRGIGDAVV
jgi:hypothetical protein